MIGCIQKAEILFLFSEKPFHPDEHIVIYCIQKAEILFSETNPI